MNYIINPAWIYWIKVVDTIKRLCFISAIGAVIVVIIAVVCAFDSTFSEKERIAARKISKVLLPIIFALIIVSIFVPSKETLIEMKLADVITTENLNIGIESVKGILNDIISAIKSV